MIIGLSVPLITLPQLWVIWRSPSLEGVSLFTWAFYALQAAVFAIFAIRHHEKPLIFTYVPLFIVQFGIVIGILVKSAHS